MLCTIVFYALQVRAERERVLVLPTSAWTLMKENGGVPWVRAITLDIQEKLLPNQLSRTERLDLVRKDKAARDALGRQAADAEFSANARVATMIAQIKSKFEKLDSILLPAYIQDGHWALLTLRREKRDKWVGLVYDSCNPDGGVDAEVARVLQTFYSHLRAGVSVNFGRFPGILKKLMSELRVGTLKNVPQQAFGSNDCAIYVMGFMAALSQKPPMKLRAIVDKKGVLRVGRREVVMHMLNGTLPHFTSDRRSG